MLLIAMMKIMTNVYLTGHVKKKTALDMIDRLITEYEEQ